jgi:hypothetical protein
MKKNGFFQLICVLFLAILVSCIYSELSWSIKSSQPDALRKLVGLPSIAVGNLNPAARNPGLELLCASFYDAPGGYCSYYTAGVSAVNLTLDCNVTVVGGK